LRQRQLEEGQGNLTSIQKEIWEALHAGPVPISHLLNTAKYPFLYRNSLSQLIEQGLVVASAFTPTDAVHVLGQYRLWSVKAAELGAILWANQLGVSVDNFCRQVVQQVEVQIGRAVIGSVVAEEKELSITRRDNIGRLLIDRALGADKGGLFSVSLDMHHPLVAIGAPVTSYLPSVAKRIHANLLIPDHADVNNAIGAVVGGVVQNVRVLIQPLDMGTAFQVHLPSEVRDFPLLEDAVAYAREVARKTARDLAHRAGASEVKVDIKREDHIVRDAREWAEEIYLGTDIIATAVGRPRIGD
jgi:N-methylhydantoinase A/oxoprolinase/acetone carboxylase beta subunit